MRRTLPRPIAASLWAIGVATVVTLGWSQPAQGLATPEALAAGSWAVVAALLTLLSVLGAGRLLRPVLGGHLGEGDVLHDLVAGHLAAALLVTPLAIGRTMTTPLCAALLGMGLMGWLVPSPRAKRRRQLDAWSAAALVGAVLLLLPALPVALAPPLDTDELSWHLAVAGRLPSEGLALGGWLDPIASRPLTLHLLYSALLVVAGDAGAKVYHLLLAGCLLAATFSVVRRHAGGQTNPAGAGAALVTALLAGSWTFQAELGLAFNDIPAALMVLAALDAALTGKRRRAALWLAAGAALSFKYSAWTGVVCAYLLYGGTRLMWDGEEGPLGPRIAALLGEWALLTVGALAVVSPWWARNLLADLHPLFPFAGWPDDPGFTFVYLDKYGVGRTATDFLALPWTLVMEARTDSFAFLGRIHPLWTFSLPVLVVGARRDPRVRLLAGLGVLAMLGWFVGPQWMRHLLPLSGVWALALGLSLVHTSRWVWSALACAWLLLLPPQLADSWTQAAKMLPAATGEVTRDEFYEEHLPAWPALRWVNEYTDRRAKIALLFTGEVHLVDREVHLGSVEDHTPSRWWLRTYGDQTLTQLREEGFTHLVVQEVHFSHRRYPFLEQPVFKAAFSNLEEQLQELLAKEATLVFEADRYGVWWLDAEARARKRPPRPRKSVDAVEGDR